MTRELRRPLSLLMIAAAVLLIGLPSCADPMPHMVIRSQALDLVSNPGWLSGAAKPELLTPSLSQGTDSADKLALCMELGASQELQLPADAPAGYLSGAAGLHFLCARKLSKQDAGPLTVEFSASIDGKVCFQEQISLHPRGPSQVHDTKIPINQWRRIPPSRFALGPGQTLTLGTRLIGALPNGITTSDVRVGWGELAVLAEAKRPRTVASPERPNLILIVMDTQRADRMTPYGYGRPTTPQAERLAARGLVFEEAWSTCSWTWPAATSLLTGLDPNAHGVLGKRTGFVPHQVKTLPEVLQQAGFTTAGFSGNPLITEDHNFHQGFEHFWGTDKSVKSDRVVPDALAWLDKNKGFRFFLYLHLQDPHLPYKTRPADMEAFTGSSKPKFPPMSMQDRAFAIQLRAKEGKNGLPEVEALVPAEMEAWFSDAYDACVHTGDHWLGVLLDQLEAWGLDGNTVILFTADHGEELLDHQNLTHGHDLWPELIHVPLILSGPGVPVGRVATPLSTRLVATTLATLGGAEALGSGGEPLLLNPNDIPNEPVFFQTQDGYWKGQRDVPIYGMRDGAWVLHWCPKGRPWNSREPTEDGEFRLFDLGADPKAMRNLADTQPARVTRMLAILQAHIAESAARAPLTHSRAGEATQALLDAIGYGQGGDH